VRVTYVILSPTFGMHQYTADLANRFADLKNQGRQSAHATVITPRQIPADRYAPSVDVQSIAAVTGTGLKRSNLNPAAFQKVYRAILASQPDVVHFTGPHIWNPILLYRLRRVGIPTIHTIHDVDPHSGTGYGRLLYVWNNSIVRGAGQILVHGQVYRDRLIARGTPADRVVYAPLLHLFTSYEMEQRLRSVPPQINAEGYALFFARLEAYKGVDILIAAMEQLANSMPAARAIIAGKGDSQQAALQVTLPATVELRNRQIGDAEALDLFRQCSVVVLPYRDATQSALIAAAFFFEKPVIVTRTGALPEYVCEGETGWIIPPNDATALARCLQAALADPLRLRQTGLAGRAWLETQSREEHQTLNRMYEQACSHRGPASAAQQQAKKGDYVHD
jgi:glycosyltransferase involved in cell wall biosynthesis